MRTRKKENMLIVLWTKDPQLSTCSVYFLSWYSFVKFWFVASVVRRYKSFHQGTFAETCERFNNRNVKKTYSQIFSATCSNNCDPEKITWILGALVSLFEKETKICIVGGFVFEFPSQEPGPRSWMSPCHWAGSERCLKLKWEIQTKLL